MRGKGALTRTAMRGKSSPTWDEQTYRLLPTHPCSKQVMGNPREVMACFYGSRWDDGATPDCPDGLRILLIA